MKYEQITLMEVIASLEGNGARPSHKGSGIGDKEVSFTLNATEHHAIALSEQHATLQAQDGRGANHSQKLKSPEENYVLDGVTCETCLHKDEDWGSTACDGCTRALNNWEPAVFGIGSKDSNAMKSSNPHSGIYKADTSRTIDLNGGNPGCNQGGMAVVETVDVRITSDGTKNARAHAYKTDIARSLSTGGDDPDSNHGGVAVCVGNGQLHDAMKPEPICKTLNCMVDPMKIVEYNEVCGTLAASDYKFPQQQQVEEGKCIVESFENSSFGAYKECETGATLKANGGDFQGGETVVNDYAVRRLTPVECERLQGMPDMWCYGVSIDPTDEELDFWLDAFETHRAVISGAKKPKTEKQVRTAIGKELTDSNIYKIQGNGIALPNAWFVLSGLE